MKLFYTEASPPCRTIVLLANLLNIELELITTSPKNGETNTSSFLRMNPQHVVPTFLDDDGYVVWESVKNSILPLVNLQGEVAGCRWYNLFNTYNDFKHFSRKMSYASLHNNTLKKFQGKVTGCQAICTEYDRAIAKYLIEKYGKNNHLYPLDFKSRVEIDKILDFDLGTVFRRCSDYFVTVILTGKFDPSKKPKVDDAMNVLNEILKRNKTNFVVGNHLTIADISLLTIVSSLEVTGYDLTPYKNVQSWLSNAKKNIPNYDTIGVKGESAFLQMFKAYEK